ncbi:MAG: START domain-containing protein [Flavobacteriales bacterium]
MIRIAAIALLLSIANTGTDWVLKKDKNEIKVYTRSVPGSKLDEFKAVTLVPNTTITHLLDILTDVPRYDRLFPDCSGTRLIERTGKYDTVHYIRTEAPFPVSDRDGVYEQRTQRSADGSSARVTIRAVPDRIPTIKGLVRIPKGNGTWTFVALGKNVKVSYQFHGEPGGDVPAWLANSFIVDHPYRTLENLRTLAKERAAP